MRNKAVQGIGKIIIICCCHSFKMLFFVDIFIFVIKLLVTFI